MSSPSSTFSASTVCWYARRLTRRSRLSLPCLPGNRQGLPALYNLLSTPRCLGLIELLSTYVSPLAASTYRFSRLIHLFYPIRPFAYISATRPHTFIPPIQPSHRLYFHPIGRFLTFSLPAGLPRQFVHIHKTPPRVSLSHTLKSFGTPPSRPPFDHIYPLRTKHGESGPVKEKSFSRFWLPFRRLFVAWPIDRVRVPIVMQLRCVTSDGPRTCTIFFVHLRLPSLSVSQGHSPSKPLSRPSPTFYQMDDIFPHRLSR